MIIRPQPKQEEFLTTKADIAVYGGAAGGGKTFGLLMSPLYHVDNPKFNAVFFRRSIVQIRNPGGLWDESMSLYLNIDAKPRQQFLDWKFESGSIIKFAHLENDSTVYNWQGSQLNMILFDELTHFTKHQFFYLLSRNRSVSGIKPQIRASTNPDKFSWVRQFIDWWIGEDGYPIAERSGVIRYFVQVDNDILWADDPDELRHIAEPKSFTFIPSKLTDNKILMEADPGYMSSLQAQNRVERARLLDGNWDIDYSDFGSLIDRTDFMRYEERLDHLGQVTYPLFEKVYFVVDSASKTKEANDYSVIGLFGKTLVDKQYYILDWFRGKLEAHYFEQKIEDLWNQHKKLGPQGIWIEDASTGIVLLQNLRRKGIPVFGLKPIKDKFTRLTDSLGIIKSKFVHIPSNASWINTFIAECEAFRADGKHVVLDKETLPHDDQVDVLAYGLGNQITTESGLAVYKPKEANKRKVSAIWS